MIYLIIKYRDFYPLSHLLCINNGRPLERGAAVVRITCHDPANTGSREIAYRGLWFRHSRVPQAIGGRGVLDQVAHRTGAYYVIPSDSRIIYGMAHSSGCQLSGY